MGLISTIKNKLGIGGVKVALNTPGQVSKAGGMVAGNVTLTTKSEQEVTGLTVKLIEEWSTGRGDSKTKKEFELGKVTVPASFTIKPGETKELAFSLPFILIKSDNEELKEKGGVMGTLGKMGSFANNEKSSYFVAAEADVKAAALDPTDKKEIRLI